MDDDKFTIKATWTPRLDGNGQAYVTEKIGDSPSVEYGPMGKAVVPLLIEELKDAFQTRTARLCKAIIGRL